MSRSRFQTFVALRYLMAHPMHVSWLALIVAGVAAATGGVLTAIVHFAFTAPDPRALVQEPSPLRQGLAQAGGIAFLVAGVCVYVFLIRIFFTFYSTVSIVGVSIGCAALVTVLSIMNGFEADLRVKILGSNAHLQVSKDDGEFVEWEEVRAKIERVPGVVASTPFATSEVVIAANSNYSNVVVKGIDVASATRVTALRKNLADPEALGRLEPLVPDPMEPPEALPDAPVDPDAIDPAPADLPTAGDPVDWSDPSAGPPALDPAPDDFAEGAEVDPDARPRDLSGTATPADLDAAARLPSRVQTLSGVLVGRELRKTMHTFEGQEVRLVSPLSDPMNPDANGTPIPFNRDYRVAGEFFTGMYEYDLKLVYVSLESLQRFLRLGDAVDGIEVRIQSPDDVDAMAQRISAAIGPEYHVQGWRELNRNLFSALKLEKIAMFLVLGIVILVASFSIVGNLIMVVVEKAREIALLKTLGASNFGVMQLFSIQGLMIGMIGTVLGIATGLLACWAGRRYGLPLNPDVYYIDRLPIHVDPQSVAAAAAAGILISIAATLYPALLAARVRPAAGMRH